MAVMKLSLLQSQGSGGQVADFGGSEVLDSTGIGEAGLNSPQLAMFSEELEGSAIQFHQSLTDNGLVSAVTTLLGLPVHHQLKEFTQTHVHRVGDAIQPFHPLLSPSPPATNPS